MTSITKTIWDVHFLKREFLNKPRHILIILNQPFSFSLLLRLWESAQWHYCADGGANQLYDLFKGDEERMKYLPDLIKGDLDSLRPNVRKFYESLGTTVVQDDDQDSTDLMKCVSAVLSKEEEESASQYHILLLGGLSGRLDQTIHTLHYLHKLRKTRERVYAITDDSIGWVLDSGEHEIQLDHEILGKTCGLLPVGIQSTILSTSGLRWDLNKTLSSFDGMVSTSNHLVPGENVVWVKTSEPIWWTVELKQIK